MIQWVPASIKRADEVSERNLDMEGREAMTERTFGSRLAAVRSARGLSQTALSERSGIRQGPISRLEGGKQFPSVPNLLRLADALDVSADALLGRRDGDLSALDRFGADDAVRRRWQGLSPKRKALAADVIALLHDEQRSNP